MNAKISPSIIKGKENNQWHLLSILGIIMDLLSSPSPEIQTICYQMAEYVKQMMQ